MANALAPPGAHTVSIARLHGEACWHCGAVNTALLPAGTHTTNVNGARREWPIVVCKSCLPLVRR